MQYPNLTWAIADRNSTHYAIAAAVGLSKSRFSRSMNGRVRFSVEERKRIAKLLGYPERWLFAEVRLPRHRNANVDSSADAVLAKE
jgi:transcriptional regulator with XRE-family HTH domain